MAKDRRRVVSFAVVVLVMIALVKVDGYLDPFDDQPFDPAIWIVMDEKQRGPMARDAIRHLPAGLHAARVRELLGEPVIIPASRDRWGVKPRQTETWEYWLGCWSGLGPYGFDSASLYVHLAQMVGSWRQRSQEGRFLGILPP